VAHPTLGASRADQNRCAVWPRLERCSFLRRGSVVAEDARSSGPANRSIPARSSAWPGWLAGRIAATTVILNQISLLSLAFGFAGGILIAWSVGWACRLVTGVALLRYIACHEPAFLPLLFQPSPLVSPAAHCGCRSPCRIYRPTLAAAQ